MPLSAPRSMSFRATHGFPKKMWIKHRYNEAVIMTAVTGTTSSYQWSCNGLFDPNTTGAGHQPLYFDQVTPLYDQYFVFSSRLTLEVIPNANCSMAMYIDDETNPALSVQNAAEQETGSFHLVPATLARPYKITKSWNARDFFGGDVFDNQQLLGTNAANPTEQSYYTLLFQSADGTTTQNLQTFVQIEYVTVWTELRQIGAS